MAKTLFNPDRSTFHLMYAGKNYDVPPGKSSFPDKVAYHLAESSKMWGVVVWVDPSSEGDAKKLHQEALKRHYKGILESYAKQNKDILAAGLEADVPAEVQEAKDFFA